MAPVSHDTLVKLMKAVKRLPKLKGKASEKVAEEIASRKNDLLEMDSIFVEQFHELLFVAELVRGTNWGGEIAIAANMAPGKRAKLVAKAKDHHLKVDVAPHLSPIVSRTD